jgi:hypothetical protein
MKQDKKGFTLLQNRAPKRPPNPNQLAKAIVAWVTTVTPAMASGLAKPLWSIEDLAQLLGNPD